MKMIPLLRTLYGDASFCFCVSEAFEVCMFWLESAVLLENCHGCAQNSGFATTIS